jgi:hypothetical protein
MTDWPIIFSGAMIGATIEGRKTMTHRLATSPLTKCSPGDRFWVRESYWPSPAVDKFTRHPLEVRYCADPDGDAQFKWWRAPYQGAKAAKACPAIHMPRRASRLTLVVTEKKIEPLLDISEEDAVAEGFAAGQLNDGFGPREIGDRWIIESYGTLCSAVGMFQIGWAELHPKWDGYSSPDVVALRFTVVPRNIDQAAP